MLRSENEAIKNMAFSILRANIKKRTDYIYQLGLD